MPLLAVVVSGGPETASLDNKEPQTVYSPLTSSSVTTPQVVVIKSDRPSGELASSGAALMLERKFAELAAFTKADLNGLFVKVTDLSEQVSEIAALVTERRDRDKPESDSIPEADEDWIEYFQITADGRTAIDDVVLKRARHFVESSSDLAVLFSAARAIAARDEPKVAKAVLSKLKSRLSSEKASRQLDFLIRDYGL